MTKAEILETIDRTICTNEQRGITAEALNLVLTDIVNFINLEPETTSAEVLTIKFYNPETPAPEEILIHNAATYAKVKKLSEEGRPIPQIVMDLSELVAAEMEAPIQIPYYVYSIMSVFVQEPVEDIVGLLIFNMIGEINILEDGSIILLDS